MQPKDITATVKYSSRRKFNCESNITQTSSIYTPLRGVLLLVYKKKGRLNSNG